MQIEFAKCEFEEVINVMENKLIAMRKQKGLSQQGMASRLGIAPSTYNQYETGSRKVPADVAEKIGSILEVEVSQIFLATKFTVSKV